jgi:pSer/pThr/pTyr-binding forkhead associated (FHA) protein
MGAAAPSAPAVASVAAPAAAPAAGGARLVLIRPDGTEGGQYTLGSGDTAIGRDTGAIFGGDSYLSPKHAMFSIRGGQMSVRDENSLNGVYVRIQRDQKVEIQHGDVFRIGQEIVRFEAVPKPQPAKDQTEPLGSPVEGLWGRLSLVIGRETVGNSFPVGGESLVIGRERGDILFPEDGYVSGVHAKLHQEGGKTFLTDLGSSNGTYVRIRKERQVGEGDFLLMGQQLFRISL